MKVTRRDFLKASAAIAGAMALKSSGLMELQKALAAGSGPPVIWLQGQGCTGCSVSLLNSAFYTTIDDVLIDYGPEDNVTIDMRFHPSVMAAAGDLAARAAMDARRAGGYVLIVEGAIPVGANGDYCHIWPDMTMIDAIDIYEPLAACILAVGTCACYGGMSAGSPNPTGAMGLEDTLSYLGHAKNAVINIPGCPPHPDWIVGTVAALLAGETPDLDIHGRPKEIYQSTVHSICPNNPNYLQGIKAKALSEAGCLEPLGCRGLETFADCPIRKWNSGGSIPGVNWCIGARNPCQGCTEPEFPDGMSPFYRRV